MNLAMDERRNPSRAKLMLPVVLVLVACVAVLWSALDLPSPRMSELQEQPVAGLDDLASPDPYADPPMPRRELDTVREHTRPRRIRVLDASSRSPLEGAQIVCARNGMTSRGASDLARLGTTNEAGLVEVSDAGPIGVTMTGYQSKVVDVGGASSPIDPAEELVVELRTAFSISVQCNLTSGAPAEGVVVSVSRAAIPTKGASCEEFVGGTALDAARSVHCVRTDAAGRATIHGLSDDEYFVTTELKGHCSVHEGTSRQYVVPPCFLEVTMAPILVARAIPPEGESIAFHSFVGIEPSNSNAAIGRAALRDLPELAQEIWWGMIQARDASGHVSLRAIAASGRRSETDLQFQPLLSSSATVLSFTESPSPLHSVTCEFRDAHDRLMGVPLVLTMLDPNADQRRDGPRRSSYASGRVESGGHVKLAEGRYILSAHSLGREWTTNQEFEIEDMVQSEPRTVVLRSPYVLQDCVVRLDPPPASSVTSWRLLAKSAGQRHGIMRLTVGGKLETRVLLPPGKVDLAIDSVNIAPTRCTVDVKPGTSESQIFIVSLRWQ